MSDRPTPETKWYVTEYPEECSFAITDGNEILVTIIGGDTIGNQCDLASRIAKLPDLERERDEAREKYGNLVTEHILVVNKLCEERDELLNEIKRLRIDAQREAENHDRMVKELEGLYDKLKS